MISTSLIVAGLVLDVIGASLLASSIFESPKRRAIRLTRTTWNALQGLDPDGDKAAAKEAARGWLGLACLLVGLTSQSLGAARVDAEWESVFAGTSVFLVSMYLAYLVLVALRRRQQLLSLMLDTPRTNGAQGPADKWRYEVYGAFHARMGLERGGLERLERWVAVVGKRLGRHPWEVMRRED